MAETRLTRAVLDHMKSKGLSIYQVNKITGVPYSTLHSWLVKGRESISLIVAEKVEGDLERWEPESQQARAKSVASP
jgi:transposase